MWSPTKGFRRRLGTPRKIKPGLNVDTSKSSTCSSFSTASFATQSSPNNDVMVAYVDKNIKSVQQESAALGFRLESRCAALEKEVVRLKMFQLRAFLVLATLAGAVGALLLLLNVKAVHERHTWTWSVVLGLLVIVLAVMSSGKYSNVAPTPKKTRHIPPLGGVVARKQQTETDGKQTTVASTKSLSPPSLIRRSQTMKETTHHRELGKTPATSGTSADTTSAPNTIIANVDNTEPIHQSLTMLDKYAGMRFNFLAQSGVSFKPLFDALSVEQQNKFQFFADTLPDAVQNSSTLHNGPGVDMPDDFNLLRFLRSDDFDIPSATKRLLKTMEWRVSRNVDRFLNGPPECFETFSQLRIRVFQGLDLEGRPILWERLGQFLGSSSAFGMLTVDEWVDCHTYEFMILTNLFRMSSMKHGRAIMEHTFVGDMAGIRLWPFLRSVPDLTTMAQNVQPHFPEIAGPLFFINAPSYAPRLWAVAKRILNKNAASKTRVIQSVGTTKLLEKIDETILLEEYGGTNDLTLANVVKGQPASLASLRNKSPKTTRSNSNKN